jgi:hypothetical protein
MDTRASRTPNQQAKVGTWRSVTDPTPVEQLVSELGTIAAGVERIEGDQLTRATFFFAHAMLEGCDREVCATYRAPTSGA